MECFASRRLRSWANLWERQSGKSTNFSRQAFWEMFEAPNRTVIYGSASLLLGSELPIKLQEQAESILKDRLENDANMFSAVCDEMQSRAKEGQVKVIDSEHDKPIAAKDFKDLFRLQRLEFRVYHSRTTYSRTKVIAPNVATARGWSGTVFLDEIAFIRYLKELIVALQPVISTQAGFRLIYGTTPPEFDDTHYAYELLAPPPGAIFRPNPRGNWYVSDAGIDVHRVDCHDSFAAGKKIYDLKTGAPITPEEAFKKALNKDGFRIAHLLHWTMGGAAACDLLRLATSQERGAVEHCKCFVIDGDADFDGAMDWLAAHIDPIRKVGVGFDVATTTKEKSNPSVLAIAEENGPEIAIRCFLVWKTKDPDVARDRIEKVLCLVAGREGGRAKAMAIDATNEKYFAEDCRKKFRRQVPVLLVVASEGVEKPGLEKAINWKEYLGARYVAALDDNHLTLPSGEYTRADHRLVKKDRGKFVCEPDDQGRHGDTFDAGKLAQHALTERGSLASMDGIRIGGSNTRMSFTPSVYLEDAELLTQSEK